MRNSEKTLTFIISLLAAVILTTSANAHGDPTAGQDICERISGVNKVHFNAYQYKPDPRTNYCNDLPGIGDTTIVVDLVSAHLRNIPVVLKIFAIDEAGKETQFYTSQPKIYRQGMMEALINFKDTGKYVAKVIIENSTDKPPSLNYNIGGGLGMSFHMPRSMKVVILVVALILSVIGITQLSKMFRTTKT